MAIVYERGIICVMILLWTVVFIVSLGVLVRGADWLIDAAERIGLAIGLSPFIVGVTIVGIGTSLPELVSSIVASSQGLHTVPVANAVGSNITNIFLVVGLAALVSRRIEVEKDLIDLDLPLFASVTGLFLLMAYDGKITLFESVILLVGYGIYMIYAARNRDASTVKNIVKTLPVPTKAPLWRRLLKQREAKRPPYGRDVLLLIVGAILLGVGANYVVVSLVQLSELLGIAAGVITIVAVAFGTSLPEVTVTLKAAKRGQAEVALGNIIGSCVFNILTVVGVSGLITTLELDSQTLSIGLPFLAGASLLFVISGISRRIHAWEGWMYLLIYVFFIGQIFSSLR